MTDEPISLGARLSQLAAEQPDRPAVTDHRRTITWREFDLRTNRIARALESIGVRQGDLVTIGLANGIEFIEACFGLWKAGATPQPISHRLPAAEAQAVMDLAETPILIAGPAVASSRPRYDVDDLLALGADDGPLEDRTAPIWKAPTSGGSTGRPKLILSGGPGVYTPPQPGTLGAWGIVHDDVAIVPGPLYHNGPFVTSVAAVTQGAHLVIMPRFDAEETLRAIDRHDDDEPHLAPADRDADRL